MLSTTVPYFQIYLSLREQHSFTFIIAYPHLHTDLKEPTRCILVKNSPRIQWRTSSEYSFASSQWEKSWALGSCGISPGSIFGVQHQPCKYSKLVRNPSQREMAGQCLLHSRRAQRVSVRTSVYRVTRQLALVIVIFHPGHNFRW